LTRPEQAALIEMSGTPRWSPARPATEFWYDGRAETVEMPPPVPSAVGSGLPEKASFRA